MIVLRRTRTLSILKHNSLRYIERNAVYLRVRICYRRSTNLGIISSKDSELLDNFEEMFFLSASRAMNN